MKMIMSSVGFYTLHSEWSVYGSTPIYSGHRFPTLIQIRPEKTSALARFEPGSSGWQATALTTKVDKLVKNYPMNENDNELCK
jgi:hypothetical protein